LFVTQIAGLMRWLNPIVVVVEVIVGS